MKSNRQNVPSEQLKRTVDPRNKDVKSFLDSYRGVIHYSIFNKGGKKIMQIVVDGGSKYAKVQEELRSLPAMSA